MKVGILVDGEAEFRALPAILSRVNSPHVILNPFRADIQPFAPVPQVVGAVRAKLPILRARHVTSLVVLVDRETRNDCPGQLAQALAAHLAMPCAQMGVLQVQVVIKNRAFENWLVADPTAINSQPKRFTLSSGDHGRIYPNKADNVDALSVIKRSTIGSSYHKVSDATRIMQRADPGTIASNSRSFRRFLRSLSSPPYATQSASPV